MCVLSGLGQNSSGLGKNSSGLGKSSGGRILGPALASQAGPGGSARPAGPLRPAGPAGLSRSAEPARVSRAGPGGPAPGPADRAKPYPAKRGVLSSSVGRPG